jgi:RHS repeat-associated protein
VYRFSGKELDEETGLSYFGARYYNSKWSVWLSVDPEYEKFPNWSPFNYCLNNPINFEDPDGNSPISVLAKMFIKAGAKKAIKEFAQNQIQKRLQNYMSKEFKKQFSKDLQGILDGMDSEWWEIGIELIPAVGDAYGTTKFGIKLAEAYDKLQDLENKYVEKIYNSLPKEAQKKFKETMRSKGVSDAKRDQKAGVDVEGETYKPTKKGDPIENRIEGHHKEPVAKKPSKMTDPRNIEFKTHTDHKNTHKKKS